MGIKSIVIITLAAATLLSWTALRSSEPRKTDPRYAAVVADQLKFRIDTLFAPADFLRDEPELVQGMILPAMGLVSYDDNNRTSN
ncbi:MAG: hypothetical protein A2901_06150 [Elusimicrobia bacterium RIFCSPLOWO2_01_FULL_54_10]|nr:MAG: hypothetical protein A2901_06150 [Elusimicrobia bacterium RIFCSPLOWO2_01_FULL_54_10]